MLARGDSSSGCESNRARLIGRSVKNSGKSKSDEGFKSTRENNWVVILERYQNWYKV